MPTLITEADRFWGSGVEPNSYNLIRACRREGDHILDIGCGRGAYVETLCRDGAECRGMDLLDYPEWDEAARRLGKPREALFTKSDPDKIPAADGAFDIVFAFEVLEHALDPLRFLAEIKRVARRHVLISVPDCHPNHPLHNYSMALHHWTDRTHCQAFTRSSLVQLLEQAGLEVQYVDGSYRIPFNRAYWEQAQMLERLRRFAERWTTYLNVSPLYYSGILVKCSL